MRFETKLMGCVLLAGIALAAPSSMASRLGRPGVSTTGATASQTQWNLISDPAYATSGSTTTNYSAPGVASVVSVQSIDPYAVTKLVVQYNNPSNHTIFYGEFGSSNNGVSITPGSPSLLGYVLPSGTAAPSSDTTSTGVETGYLQVFWQFKSGYAPPPSTSSDVPTDDNVFEVTFQNISGNPHETATFTNYEDAGYANGGHSLTPDSYSGFYKGQAFTYSADPNSGPNYVSNFDTQTVTLPVGLPEPTSAGVVAMATIGLLIRRRLF